MKTKTEQTDLLDSNRKAVKVIAKPKPQEVDLPTGGRICEKCGQYVWRDGWGNEIVYKKIIGGRYIRAGRHECEE